MMHDLQAVRAACDRATARLVEDPYDFAAVLEALLAHAVLGALAESQVKYAILERLNLSFTNNGLLKDIAQGSCEIIRFGQAWYVFDQGWRDWPDPDGLLETVDHAISQVFGHLSLPVPVLLIQISALHPFLDFSSRKISGAGYVRIARREDYNGLARIARHELAHLVLHSGCRFLDEGAAVLMELTFEGTDLPKIVQTLCQNIFSETLPSVRESLCKYQGRLVFDGAAQDVGRTAPAYKKAAALVGRIVLRQGWLETVRLFAAMAGQTQDRWADILERTLGTTLENIGIELGETIVSPNVQCVELRSQFGAARAKGDIETLHEIATICPVGAFSDDDPGLSTEIWSALILLSIQQARPLPDSAITQLSASLAVLPDELQTLRLRAMSDVEIAKLTQVPDVFAKAIRASKARQHLRAALERTPGDPEAALRLAVIEIHTPVEYGGNHAEAERLLAEAAVDNRLLNDVRAYTDTLKVVRSATR